MPQLTILIADDHAIVRHGLSALLATEPDFQVIGAAENGWQAVAMTQKFRPDIVILDLAMPRLNGVDAIKEIRKVAPATKVLVLSSYSDEETVVEAIKAGAVGFLTKCNAATELIASIRAVLRGLWISPEILRHLRLIGFDPLNPNNFELAPRVLTARETEVLQAIADGLTNKAIAAELGISIKTVEKHRQRLMDKLDLHETAGLTRYALAHKIRRHEVSSI